jgi:dienelactone hydrolase
MPDSTRYGLVLIQGRDTVGFERVTESLTHDGGRVTRAEVFVPNRARLLVTARAGSDGCVMDTEVRVYPWGAAVDATPVQRVAVRIAQDSVRIHVMARGVEQRATRPAPNVRAIVAQESEAAAATIVACALHLLRRGDALSSDSLTLPTLVYPNLHLEALRLRQHQDTLTMHSARDTALVLLDAVGAVRETQLNGGRLIVRRVPIRALADIAIAAPDYSAPADAPYTAQTVRFTVGAPSTQDEVVLAGTLTLPRDATAPVPAVVLISGSGGQDRDSYAPVGDGWRPFRQLADTLGRRGVAVLRFDDRGVGASGGDQGRSTERTGADDVMAALRYLKTLSSVDPHRLAILGHSEGARVAMIVAGQERDLAGVALLAGAADPRAVILAQARWQIDHNPRLQLARDSVLAMVVRQADSLAQTSSRELYRWNAADHARKIRAPIAIFHGGTDRQVPAEQADSLAAVFKKTGHRAVVVRVFPDRNHLFLRDPNGDFLQYGRLSDGRVDTEVTGAITDWLVAQLRRR